MDEKIHNLLRLATDSGASAHEAHTAASIAVTLARMRCVIVERERQPSWGKQASIPDVAEAR